MSIDLLVKSSGSLYVETDGESHSRVAAQIDFEENFVRCFAGDHAGALFYLGIVDVAHKLNPSLQFWREFSQRFVSSLKEAHDLEVLRGDVELPIPKTVVRESLETVPFTVGAEYITESLLQTQWEQLLRYFSTAIASYKGTVREFLQQFAPNLSLYGKVFFHLVEHKGDQSYPFAFLVTYASVIDERGRTKHLPLKAALNEYSNDEQKLIELLTTVRKAAQSSAFISSIIESGEIFYPLLMTVQDAHQFLKETPAFEDLGIHCRIPDWWKRKGKSALLQITVGDDKMSDFGAGAIIASSASFTIDGVEITKRELEKLLENSEELALIKGRWVAFDGDKLASALDVWSKAEVLVQSNGLTFAEAVRALMAPTTLTDALGGASSIEVSCGTWLEGLFEKLKDPSLAKSVKPGRGFEGNLRPYQQNGLNWLALLDSIGVSGCLADDMGLGKTIQVIAFLNLLRLRRSKAGAAANLLIVPASLIGNWMAEIERFCPKLGVRVAHRSAGDQAFVGEVSKESLDDVDVVITTYSSIRRQEWVKKFWWNYIILDEAQSIKNAGTNQTKAIKALKSHSRLALTGTPVENRIGDLWSLFDFLNPGLLGTPKEFAALFKDKRRDNDVYSRVRSVIRPYILRRLKTDKSIIKDLPEKIEMETFAELTKKQVALYIKVVADLERALEESEGIKRRGIVLSTLMKLKQICNHPDQFIGQGDYLEKESGKLARLRELCEVISEKREQVLVFTQFKEVTKALDSFLESVFGRSGLVLTGSTSVGKRKQLVDTFQSGDYVPYFVISVKAGGTGLNLTAANHVIHFDRWWNPAVENQATDRAFRIGQRQNVMVHKFVTKGTIEEKIARMLREKQQLSNDIIGESGEMMLTELSDKEIIDLVRIDMRYAA
jgi:superfamily II DNA or RNA helicase